MQTAGGGGAILPMDYLCWSPQLDKLVSSAGPHGEIGITGTATPLATENLANRGWKVLPNVAGRLLQGPKSSLAQFLETATPQGATPTGSDFTTFRLGTSMTETSLLLPFVTNSSFSYGVRASCQTR